MDDQSGKHDRGRGHPATRKSGLTAWNAADGRFTHTKPLAAGIGPTKNEGLEERYRDVKLLTPVPTKSGSINKFMPFSQVTSVTGESFYGARTIKVPYLSREESQVLLTELKKTLA